MSHPAPGVSRDPDWVPANAVVVTVVQSPACHFCEDAEQALSELSRCYPLMLDLVDIRSGRGRALIQEHRPAMSPLVLLDGTFFSAGRLPRRKLAAALDKQFADASAALLRALRTVG